MGLSRDEIRDLASRYITESEMTDFPFEGDVFSLLVRDVPDDKVLKDDDGWAFAGYGLCIGYVFDYEAKPRGKWLWMHFAGLTTFPPLPQSFKLQPPHVVKGRFSNPERTKEYRIVKIDLKNALNKIEEPVSDSENIPTGPTQEPSKATETKIIQFRKKNG